MQVFIKTLTGKVVVLEVSSENCYEEIKQVAGDSEFVFPEHLTENAIIDLFEIDDGGKKKKRKKKNFVSKKRVPHTRKKEKLKLLKLFKISKDGTVEFGRQMCPHCKGSFMAKHKDGRLYCGSCHHTILKAK